MKYINSLKTTKTMTTTKLLEQVYMEYYNQYGEKGENDFQISIILDRIDELQTEIKKLNT
jgi:hypothetical protein